MDKVEPPSEARVEKQVQGSNRIMRANNTRLAGMWLLVVTYRNSLGHVSTCRLFYLRVTMCCRLDPMLTE
jgi:hypothetical protein